MTTLSDDKALSVLINYVFENKDKIGGEISLLKDKNGVLDFVLNQTAKTEQNESQAFEIEIDKVVDRVKKDFARFVYNKRFDRTATKKKITSALKATNKAKRLYSYQIVFAFRKYLQERYFDETDEQFVKLASSFMTNMVYDYAETINDDFEKMMVETYGCDWRKVKFVYV